jgi:hypothetical protein
MEVGSGVEATMRDETCRAFVLVVFLTSVLACGGPSESPPASVPEQPVTAGADTEPSEVPPTEGPQEPERPPTAAIEQERPPQPSPAQPEPEPAATIPDAPVPPPPSEPAPPVATVTDPGGAVEVEAAKSGLTRIGAEKCKVCHKVQFASWSESAHAKRTPPLDCESCHGAGSEYKSLSVMKDLDKSLAAGLVQPDEEFCKTCHVGWTKEMMTQAHEHKDDGA